MSCSIGGRIGVEKAGWFSRRPSGASESMVASENKSVMSEKAVGGLEFGVFAMSSGSRRRGVVGNIGVYVCKAEGELWNALKVNIFGRGCGLENNF